MNPTILLSLLPVAVFLYLTRVSAPWVAILGGMGASAAVLAVTRRDRLIGALTLFGFLVTVVAGIVGLVQGSERAYLAAGPISDFFFVPLYGISVAKGYPLVGGVARELVPAVARRIPVNSAVYRDLSVAWALFDIAHGAAAAVLLQRRLSVAEYVIWSRVVLWPFSGALLLFTATVIWRQARRELSPVPDTAGCQVAPFRDAS